MEYYDKILIFNTILKRIKMLDTYSKNLKMLPTIPTMVIE